MATAVYVAIVEGDEGGGYAAYFPDLPGCVTAADTMPEILASAREALALHLQGMIEDEEIVPEPTPIERIERDPDVDEVGRILVDAEVEDAPVRVNISISARLLKRVDTAAEVRGMSRSGFLVEGARLLMDQREIARPPASSPATVSEPRAKAIEYASSPNRYLVVPADASPGLAIIWDLLEEAVVDVIEFVSDSTRTHEHRGQVIRFPEPTKVKIRHAS